MVGNVNVMLADLIRPQRNGSAIGIFIMSSLVAILIGFVTLPVNGEPLLSVDSYKRLLLSRNLI